MTGFSWSKASWETAQCAEKVMKAVLVRAGCKHIPKGRDGHDIRSLGHVLEREGGVSLDARDLGLIHCDPRVRCGEEVVNFATAYAAHRALLRLLKALSGQLGISEYA
jgi:HEPN domain-containing protein